MDNDNRVTRILHDAHLRFQRAALRSQRDVATLPDGATLACDEVRGLRYRYTLPEWLQEQRLHQRNACVSGLRSNFWRAYVDTIVFMSKP